ncbi:MAG: protein HflC [Isosphaeraceae bacterium]|jgi:membrane protease subunit HflC|nr:MAG: protein HflC [Isosphaeraceae bacterium]
MNSRQALATLIGLALLLAVPVARLFLYTVNEQEMAVLLQFGSPVASRTSPGLYFKIPFIQEELRLPKTLQVWHGTRSADRLVDVPTADGKKIEATVWAVWRITDPVQFVRTLRTVANAEARVKEFVRSTARDTITTHNLAELIRSTDRQMTYTLGLPPEMLAQAAQQDSTPAQAELPDFVVPPEAREPITLGRPKLIDQIRSSAQRALAQDARSSPANPNSTGRGIQLVDVGLSRIEFVPEVREAAFNRAIALMEAIAIKATSEGEQRKQEIINRAQAEAQKIEGEGKQLATALRGQVEAEIIDAYAAAIRQTGDFYRFSRSLDILKETLGPDSRLILTTDSQLLRLLKQLDPDPATPPSGTPIASPAAPNSPE